MIFRTLFQNRTEVNTKALLHSEVQNQIRNRILEIHSSCSTVTAIMLNILSKFVYFLFNELVLAMIIVLNLSSIQKGPHYAKYMSLMYVRVFYSVGI